MEEITLTRCPDCGIEADPGECPDCDWDGWVADPDAPPDPVVWTEDPVRLRMELVAELAEEEPEPEGGGKST